VIFYALSNAGLYFVDESVFRNIKFNVLLVGLDTLVLTASLIINGQVEANFYLAYFLLIIICSIFENPRMIAIVSLAAPFAYAGFFFSRQIIILAITSGSLSCSWSDWFMALSRSSFERKAC
jgi:hypothetical protein